MRIGRKPSFVIGALALGLIAGGSAKADETGELDAGIFAGYHIFSDTNNLGYRGAVGATSADSGPLFGLRVGYGLFPHVTLEAEGAFVYSHTRADTGDHFIGAAYRANVLIRVTPDGLGGNLFLVGGVGGMTVGSSDDKTLGLVSDTKFFPHAGLAAKVDLGDNWGLRMDGRIFFDKSYTADTALDWEGTAAIYYVWGRKPKTPPPPPDRDGDGVPDASDACPDQAGPASADPKTNGCPPAPDKDADGIPDAQDACPEVAGVKTDDPKTNGCPSDRDHDGIPDDKDKCPDQPETMNGYQDEDGCPDEVPKAVQKFTGVIQGINFEINSAKITKGSFKVLDAAAKVLVDFPSVRMEIQGHTDDTGEHDYNLKLSQDRAQSVKDYMVAKGVEERRLKPQGYGPDKPLDPAKTKAARAKNRRVEFQIIRQ